MREKKVCVEGEKEGGRREKEMLGFFPPFLKYESEEVMPATVASISHRRGDKSDDTKPTH